MEEKDLNPADKEKRNLSSANESETQDQTSNSTNKFSDEQKIKVDQIPKEKILSENKIKKKDSIFNRILENGFDGITTNPNYKLLALLIILLINLSLFFVVGNIGKSFLKNSGILS